MFTVPDLLMCGSRNFVSGGGGGGVQVNPTKISSDIFQGSRGGPTFSRGGSNFFRGGGGGSNCLFPIETHITCYFPGGGVRTPCPPSGSALVLLYYSHVTLGYLATRPIYDMNALFDQFRDLISKSILKKIWKRVLILVYYGSLWQTGHYYRSHGIVN